MRHSDLRRLNKRFAEAFGRPDGTQPKYKWCRTTDLQYFLKTGTVEQKTAGGIYFVAPKFKRCNWADRLGDTWIIAQWKAPDMSADRWLAVHGTSIPYPASGRYLPIDNTALPPGMEPTEDITIYAVRQIGVQLEKTYAELVEEGQQIATKGIEDAKKQWADIVDDRWPAFDGVPGMKLHTSFPTPQRLIHQP
jgi:hypothetical protein